MMKVSTFCSGIGSPEQALKNLGIEHEIVLTAEIDKYARQTYLANHHTQKMITDMTEPDYEGEEWYSDINISGLPCQSFSLAGKRLGELDPLDALESAYNVIAKRKGEMINGQFVKSEDLKP